MNNNDSESQKKLLDTPLLSPSEVYFDDDPNGSKKWHTVGRGVLGSVYAGMYHNHPVVIKTLDDTSPSMKQQCTYDAKIQYSIQSDYIVSLKGLMEKDHHLSIVEERMAATLYQHLKDNKALTWVERYRLAYEIGQGLCVLHRQSIVHKNLTSRNVFLDAQNHVKLGEVALLVQRSSFHTPAYKAPELHQHDLDFSDSDDECEHSSNKLSHSFASDVYAYGVLLWELTTGKTPFYGKNGIQIHQRIVRGKHEKIPTDCPEAFAQIIKDCWQSNPSDRPDMESLIEQIQELHGTSFVRYFDLSLPVPVTQSYGLRVAYETVLPPEGLVDVQKVFHAYQLGPVPGYDIAKIEVIHNPGLNKDFAACMSKLATRRVNSVSPPAWYQEAKDTPEQKSWRASIVQRFSQWSEPHKDQLNPHIDLLPLWHGTHPDQLTSLFTGGYANVPKTDSGFFGNGIYSAVEASYAYRVHDKGVLIVNWVALGSPYPVIDGDMEKLEGKTNYQNYDAHIVPVRPNDPNNPEEVLYYPCKPNQEATHHEVVVFNDRQCVPRYVVTLQPILPLVVSQEQTFSQHPAFQAFLQHVAYGNQNEAEALLKKTPELVLGRGKVTDYRKKTFDGTTALQYTLWAAKERERVYVFEEKVKKFSKDADFKVFLKHVALGNQDEAEALLKKTPGLVLGRGNVRDYSGRIFKNITALQYTMWALDQYMFQMMMPYFEQIQASYVMGEQSVEWRRMSQAYVGAFGFRMKPDTDYFDYGLTEKAYSDCLKGLKEKNSAYSYGRRNLDREKLKKLCSKIGQQQFFWPAHFALEMTTSDRAFSPLNTVDFNQVKRPSCHPERSEHWFYHSLFDKRKSSEEGLFPVVVRGQSSCAELLDTPDTVSGLDQDAQALKKLSEARVNAMLRLRAQVEVSSELKWLHGPIRNLIIQYSEQPEEVYCASLPIELFL